MNSNHSTININNRLIGDGGTPFIIAEIAQAHDGSLGMAHAYIEAAAHVGADAVKFQTHIARAESTVDEPFRVKFSEQDDTRYAYWKRMEFTSEQWQGLSSHASELGLVFLSSPFSIEALNLLDGLDVPLWKVASGEVSSKLLLNAMIDTGKPIIISSGMSYWREIDETVNYLRKYSVPFGVFQCTSMYPTPLERVGLNILDDLRDKYCCPVGLSDHSGTVYPAISALSRGANMLELHITMDKLMFGPDTTSSLDINEFKQVCDFRDALVTMESNPLDKDKIANELNRTRGLFMRSIALEQDQPAGTILTAEMLTAKKPGTGILYKDMDSIVGKKLIKNVSADRLISRDDLSD